MTFERPSHWSLALMAYICLALTSLGALASSNPYTDKIQYLIELRNQNKSRLVEIDEQIKKELKQQTSGDLHATSDKNLKHFESRIEHLRQARKEHLLRQDFIHRLIFQTNSYYRGGPLKAFLERSLTEMAEIEAKSPDGDTSLWKFLTYLSSALKNLASEDHDLFAVIEGYMNYSTLSSPKPPHDFLSQRNYSNGSYAVAGNPVSREEVGTLVEEQLKETRNHSPIKPQPALKDISGHPQEAFEVITRKRSPLTPSNPISEEVLSLGKQADPNLEVVTQPQDSSQSAWTPEPIQAIVEKLKPADISRLNAPSLPQKKVSE